MIYKIKYSNGGNYFKPIENYPHRTPLDIGYSIKEFIKDKVVCDIGCGAGDILEFLKINNFCKEVKGIEYNSQRYPKNRSYIINGDFYKGFPDADVYLMWLAYENFDYEKLFNQMKDKKMIINMAPNDFANEEYFKDFAKYKGIKLIKINSYQFDESKYIDEDINTIIVNDKTWELKGTKSYGVYIYEPPKII